MFAWTLNLFRAIGYRFYSSADGSVVITFALTLIPLVGAIGTAVDYSRANAFKVVLQSSLDSSLLAGAKDGSSNWTQVAINVFKANLSLKSSASLTPTFNLDANGSYTGSITTTVPTTFLEVFKIKSITVTANGAAKATPADDSCILTLDHGQSTSHISLTLNGAPVINLTGCSIRSNTSLNCNGHDGNVTKGIAAGNSTDCGQPKSYQPVVPDIYVPLAKNITPQCGSQKPGVDWVAGSTIPSGAGVKKVSVGSYTEYHICGNLNLSRTGYL